MNLSDHMFLSAIENLGAAKIENERLRAAIEDAIETLEAMDLHVDNPLYNRLVEAIIPDPVGGAPK